MSTTSLRARRAAAGAAAALLAIGGLAGPLLRVVPAAAGSGSCSTPGVSAIGIAVQGAGAAAAQVQRHGPAQSQVVLQGSNLDFFNHQIAGFGCTQLTVAIGGTQVAVFTNSSTINSGGTQLTFPLKTVASGPVVVTESDSSNGSVASNANVVFATDPTVGSIGPAAPAPGQALSAPGNGLRLGSQVATATVSFSGTGCPSSVAATVTSDTSLSVPAFSRYCDGSASLVETFYSDIDHTKPTIALPALALGAVDVQGSISAPSPPQAVAGGVIGVPGAALGTAGSATLAGVPLPSSWSDSAVRVPIPDGGVTGTLQLTRAADGQSYDAGTITVVARVDGVSPSTATEGDSVTVSGGGFGPAPGTVSIGSTVITPTAWSPTAVTFTVPANLNGGGLQLSPKDTAPPASMPALRLAARLGALTPTTVGPGDSLEITGLGFGTSPGQVTIDGVPTPVQVWGDGQIVVVIPAGLQPGTASVVVVPVGVAGVTGSLTVAVRPTSSATPGATPAPAFTPNPNGQPTIIHGSVAFQRPQRPNSPVTLTLASPAEAGAPGETVPFTATLVAFGKPVSGATVTLQLVAAPGADAVLTPATAVTDSLGQVHGTVRLSHTAGDHIILAASGTTSDEIRLTGRDTGKSSVVPGVADDPISSPGPPKALIMTALVACLVLFMSGFAIQMLVPRRVAATANGAGTAPGLPAPVRPAAPSLGLRVVEGCTAVAALMQFIVVAAVMVPATVAGTALRSVRRG